MENNNKKALAHNFFGASLLQLHSRDRQAIESDIPNLIKLFCKVLKHKGISHSLGIIS